MSHPEREDEVQDVAFVEDQCTTVELPAFMEVSSAHTFTVTCCC